MVGEVEEGDEVGMEWSRLLLAGLVSISPHLKLYNALICAFSGDFSYAVVKHVGEIILIQLYVLYNYNKN